MTNPTTTPDSDVSLGYVMISDRQRSPLSLTNPSTKQDEAATSATHSQAPSSQATPKTDPAQTVNWEKRYGDLRADTEKRTAELVEQLRLAHDAQAEKDRQLQEARTVKRVLPLNDEELKALQESFPEWNKLATTQAIKIAEEELAPVKKEMDDLRKQLKEQKTKEAKEWLSKIHPDWQKFQTDDEFKVWYLEQPQGIKSLIDSDNVHEVSRGLDLYKKEKNINTKTKKDIELEASMGARVDSPLNPEAPLVKLWKRSEIKKMTAREYEKNAVEINKAQSEGRILDE
jgi:hypothetical protein